MADVYIDSTATGANNGTSWADAYNAGTHVDWNSAMTDASAAGDIVWVAHDNATVSGADINLTANANHTQNNPLRIVVANSSTGDPVTDYGTAGNGEVDANNLDFDITGHFYISGLRVISMDGSAMSGGSGGSATWEKCLYSTDKGTAETFGNSSEGQVLFKDSDIDFSGADHNINLPDNFVFRMEGGSMTTDANVNEIFIYSANAGAVIDMNHVDMTGINATTDLINDTSTGMNRANFNFCKWNATLPTIFGAATSELSFCDKVTITGSPIETQTQYRFGTVLDETTIRMASGATDGTTDYSLKVESNSNAARNSPLRHFLALVNAGDLDTKTIKVHFAQNSGAAIDDNDIWIECYALTSSGVKLITDRLGLGETTTTNHTDESGNVDWRNGASALSGYNEQSCSVTVSGATTGILQVFLCVGADFTTTNNLYVNPKVVVS